MQQHRWTQNIILSEARKRQTNIIWYNLYVEPNMQHKWTLTKQTHSQRTDLWLVAKVEGFRRGRTGEIGISRCKLSCLEWINKALLYTENYGQHPVIKHDEKNMKKKLFTIFTVLLNYFTVQQKLIQYCKSYLNKTLKN